MTQRWRRQSTRYVKQLIANLLPPNGRDEITLYSTSALFTAEIDRSIDDLMLLVLLNNLTQNDKGRRHSSHI